MREEICKAKGITPAMLSYALNFKRNSDRASSSRLMAMKSGGILFVEKEDWDNDLLLH